MNDVDAKQESLAQLEEVEAEESSDESQGMPEAAEDPTQQVLENEVEQEEEEAVCEPLEQQSEKQPSRGRRGRR